jgi:hypothetical protein
MSTTAGCARVVVLRFFVLSDQAANKHHQSVIAPQKKPTGQIILSKCRIFATFFQSRKTTRGSSGTIAMQREVALQRSAHEGDWRLIVLGQEQAA